MAKKLFCFEIASSKTKKKGRPPVTYLFTTVKFSDVTLNVTTIRNFSEENEAAEKRLGTGVAKKDKAPYYGLIWDSARTLATIISQKPQGYFEGKHFLELGAGLALPSMVVAKRGGQATAVDFHPDAKTLLEENLRLNGLEKSPLFTFVLSDWKGISSLLENKIDCLIGSDIIYDREKALSLADTILQGFEAGVKEAVIVDAGRPHLKDFEEKCRSGRLLVETTPHEISVNKKNVMTFVVTIKKKGGH